MPFQELIKISRPRFWIYLLGPLLIGRVGGLSHLQSTWGMPYMTMLGMYLTPIMWFFALLALDYFTFSANLWVYGINDLADGDTDALNEKKNWYESAVDQSRVSELQRKILLFNGIEGLLLLWVVVYVQLFVFSDIYRWTGALALVLFWLSSYFYSSLPIRAKAHPIVDGVFNVLYILPSVIGRHMAWNSIDWFSWVAFGAAWLWAMAMHAYSAIPDIEPDAQAWLTTTAVLFGKTGTLVYCVWLRFVACMTAYKVIGMYAIIMWIVYLSLVFVTMLVDTMRIYKRFPIINWVLGFGLFWWVLLG